MLIAYHNDPAVKAETVSAMQADIHAQRLVPGQYWNNGKGCFVGCVVRGSDHAKFETKLGIPQMLARLADTIFEGLPSQKKRDAFALDYLNAVRPGADLSRVGWAFLHWLLTDETINPGIAHPLVKDAIAECADLICRLKNGETVSRSAAWSAESAARSAAWSAAWSAERSAESAARSAESAARSAWSAAWSAERSAESAARSAESAARSAESAAWSAESAAWSAERSAAYVAMAGKLIELIEAAPGAPASSPEAA